MSGIARPGNQSALAKRLGVSRKTVSLMKKAGKVVMTGSTIDEAATVKMYQDRLSAQTASPERRMINRYAAKTAKLKYQKAVALLVEQATVDKEAFETARIVRDALMRLPDRLAGTLAALTDQKKIHALLTKEFRQVLEALSHSDTEPAA